MAKAVTAGQNGGQAGRVGKGQSLALERQPGDHRRNLSETLGDAPEGKYFGFLGAEPNKQLPPATNPPLLCLSCLIHG